MFLDKASSTIINNKGLNTEPLCNPIWTRKPSLKVPLALTWLQALLYINVAILTNHSPKLSFLKVHHTISLGTWSKACSKSANAKWKFFFFAKYFFCNCLKIKMTFVVPHPGIKPNYISSISAPFLINFSIVRQAIFRNWSVNFSRLEFAPSKELSFPI